MAKYSQQDLVSVPLFAKRLPQGRRVAPSAPSRSRGLTALVALFVLIKRGRLDLGSVNAAGFGCGLDVTEEVMGWLGEEVMVEG